MVATRSGVTTDKNFPSSGGSKSSKEDSRPQRPTGLRREIMRLYLALGAISLAFAVLTFVSESPVPEGSFRKENGKLIRLDEFDPSELGPYPKCHEHYGEHLSSSGEWVKNSDLEEDVVDFPIGHPENNVWKKKMEKKLAEKDKLSMETIAPTAHLLFLAVTVVYLGSKHAVWLHAKPGEKDESDDVELDKDVISSSLQDSDAYWFPVMGSAVLFSLFIVYKYLDFDLLKFLFSCYVVFMCTNGLGINLGQIVAVYYNSRGLGRFKTLFVVPFLDIKVTWIDITAYAFACAIGIFYISTKNWIANNVMGLSFCLLGMKHIGISSYRTGVIMLAGLFFYDVFWVFGSTAVFGSNVMVTVATGVEAPIKLMFPRSQDGCGNTMFSMLGLGDIVVPGLVIAFLAKYDSQRPEFLKNNQYLFLDVTMISYTMSLVTTVLVMLVFNHAQPALLYIVPYVIVASATLAFQKGEFNSLNEYIIKDNAIDIDIDIPSVSKEKPKDS